MKRQIILFLLFILMFTDSFCNFKDYGEIVQDPYERSFTPLPLDDTKFYKITNFNNIYEASVDGYMSYKYQIIHNFQLLKNKSDEQIYSGLDQFPEKPEILPLLMGDLVYEYSNAKKYIYPKIDGAHVIVFSKNEYRIEFDDKSKFVNAGKTYYLEDSSGIEIYAGAVDGSWYRLEKNGIKYEKNLNSLVVNNGEYEITKINAGKRFQYQLNIEKLGVGFFFFADSPDDIFYTQNKQMTFGYVDEAVSVQYGKYSITITKENQRVFGTSGAGGDIDSTEVTFPTGITLRGLGSVQAYSEFDPFWASKYTVLKKGGLNFYYTNKSETKLSALDSSLINKAVFHAASTLNLNPLGNRVVVIPDSIEEFVKIAAAEPSFSMSWFPAGYEYLGFIVLWPFGYQRYVDQKYDNDYYSKDIYGVIAHEYTHLMLHSYTGITSRIPVWLDEGFAMYSQITFDEDGEKFYENKVREAINEGTLPDFRSMTTTSLFAFSTEDAYVRYGVAYFMVKKLINQFGVERLMKYLKLFRNNENRSDDFIANKAAGNFYSYFSTNGDNFINNLF